MKKYREYTTKRKPLISTKDEKYMTYSYRFSLDAADTKIGQNWILCEFCLNAIYSFEKNSNQKNNLVVA